MNFDPKIMAQRIRFLRARDNLTAKDMAIKAGISEASARRISHGMAKSGPQTDTLLRVAKTFGVSIDWLCGNGSLEEGILRR